MAVILLTPNVGRAQSGVSPDSLKGRLLELGVQGADPFASEQVAALATLVALEVTTAPMGTSTGAFTYTWDATLGTFRRSTGSFGPAFAERSLTIGKGRLAVGFNWLRARYDSVAGWDLSDGTLLVTRNFRVVGAPFADSALQSDLGSDTAVGFASYGVTDDLEIAVAVPWVNVTMNALVTSFDSEGTGLAMLEMPRTSANGLGDIALIGKYHLWHHQGGGLSAGVELRLPSGDTDQLRGLGITRTLVSAIWSRGGTVSPHANVGYEFWSSDVPLSVERGIAARNQLRYAAGVEWTPHPRITAAFDVVGRRQFGGGALEHVHVDIPPLESAEPLVPIARGIDVVSLAPGVKWNIGRNVLITASVLGSLKNDGLRAMVVPVVGFDWAF